MSEGKNSHILEPAKFDVNKFRRTSTTTTTEASTPDQFGQQYNSDYDRSKWSDITPADSRRQHARADTDMSPRSAHHTLGIKHSQASPGDHIHDGTTSKKIGPLQMTSGGTTQAVWTIPASPTVADIVNLIKRFVEVRSV